MQRTTKSGKPIISRLLGTPLHSTPVDMRIKNAKKELGYNNNISNEQRWNNITNNIQSITL